MWSGYTAWGGLRRADPKPGAKIAVVGVGALGRFAIQDAKAAGYHVTAVTHTAAKHELARQLGADDVVADGTALKEAGGADALMHTSRSHAALTDAMNGLKPWGKAVMIAIATDELTVPAGPLTFQNYQLIGSAHNGWEYLVGALDFVARGAVKPMIDVYPKERLGEAYETVRTGKARFKAVVTF